MRRVLLMPCIAVYKIIFIIFSLPILFCKYFYKGIKTCLLLVVKLILMVCKLLFYIIKYIFDGFLVLCLFIFHIFKYALIGFKVILPIKVKPKTEKVKVKKVKEPKKINNVKSDTFNLKEFKQLQAIRKEELKRIEKADARKLKLKDETEKTKDKKQKKKSNDSYVNEKVAKPSLSHQQFSDIIKAITSIPKKIKDKINNNEFVKHSRNKNLMKREALLINFDGEDAEKSDTKILYEYVAKNPEGKIVKDYFEAFSKVEVHSFLLSEGFEVYSIRTNKWIQKFHKNANVNNTKFKNKDLIFFLTQLSTYIKSGIPLVDSLRILERQYKNKNYKKILKSIIYDLTMGENFSEALDKQNVAFPRLLINMVKTSEMTGELPEVLDDQAEYYSQVEKIRKQMITAMLYPSMVFIASIGVAVFIMLFVIPQFVEIYESMDASQIPQFTLIILAISDFLKHYGIWLLIGIIAVAVLLVYMYKNIKAFRTICQLIAMKMPGIGKIIIYNEVAMFTKTFSSLLAHNVFITDSMDVLNKMTNNEIYKMIILDTITNLAKGDKISEAFKDHWAFPIPAYEMLVTGEKTGELPEMMGKVAAYYQELHENAVAQMKTFIEPAITIFLTVIVGTLILAIIIPMFNMYTAVQGM